MAERRAREHRLREAHMRWAIAVLAALAVGTADGGAQERTLVGDHVESGGFGAPVVKFTEVLGDFAVLAGGRGAWIIDHTIMIGGGGYGLVNDVYDFRLVPAPRIQFGSGGLELAVVAASNSVVHCSWMSLVGGGGIDDGRPRLELGRPSQSQSPAEWSSTSLPRDWLFMPQSYEKLASGPTGRRAGMMSTMPPANSAERSGE